MGVNLERKFSDNLTAGVSVINTRKTTHPKVQMGQESNNNDGWFFNLMYNNQAPFLTRLTDKIPFVNTRSAF